MEFKDFVEKRKRMCKQYSQCCGCPLYSEEFPNRFLITCTCEDWCFNYPELAEPIIDDWAKLHPILTNAAKFKEVFGVDIDYSLDYPGYLYVYDAMKEPSFDHTENIKKWLESEYIAPEEK